MNKWIVGIMAVTFLLVGCTQTTSIDPKTIVEIQQFLSENPNLTINGIAQTKEQVELDADFQKYCNGAVANDYLKVTIKDEESALNGVAWVDSVTQKVICFAKIAFSEGKVSSETTIQKDTNVGGIPDSNEPKADLMVSFTVFNKEGNPAKGAEVEISNQRQGTLVKSQLTDEQGKTVFYLPSGSYVFRAMYYEGMNNGNPVSFGAKETFNVVLENVEIKVKAFEPFYYIPSQSVPDSNTTPIPDSNQTSWDSNSETKDTNEGIPDTNGLDWNKSTPDSNQDNWDTNIQIKDTNDVNPDSNGFDWNHSIADSNQTNDQNDSNNLV